MNANCKPHVAFHRRKTDVYEKQIEGAKELADEVIARAKNGRGE